MSYFQRSISIFSSCSDHPCRVILCLLRLNHLKRQESVVVPGISEDISFQLSWTLWISAIVRPLCSQCLHINHISIFRSQTLQFRFSLRVFVILHKYHCYFSIRFSVQSMTVSDPTLRQTYSSIYNCSRSQEFKGRLRQSPKESIKCFKRTNFYRRPSSKSLYRMDYSDS